MCSTRHKVFAALYVILFTSVIWICTGWSMDIITYASIPIIVCAESIVLGMVYMTVFHGEATPAEHAVSVAVTPPDQVQKKQPEHIGKLQSRSA